MSHQVKLTSSRKLKTCNTAMRIHVPVIPVNFGTSRDTQADVVKQDQQTCTVRRKKTMILRQKKHGYAPIHVTDTLLILMHSVRLCNASSRYPGPTGSVPVVPSSNTWRTVQTTQAQRIPTLSCYSQTPSQSHRLLYQLCGYDEAIQKFAGNGTRFAHVRLWVMTLMHMRYLNTIYWGHELSGDGSCSAGVIAYGGKQLTSRETQQCDINQRSLEKAG